MSAIATVEKNTGRSSTSPRMPFTGWIWLGSVIGVLGLAAVILWGVIGVTGYLNRVNDLSRMPVPGQMTVQIPGAGEQFVYYEGQGSASMGELGMRVADPHGQTVALEPYRLDLRYDHSGQVGRALATFWANESGPYRVNATGTAPTGSRIAVGESVAKSVIITLLGIIALLLVSLGGGLALVIVTLVRRSRARTPSPKVTWGR
jgi:hypothetical protein